MAKSWVFASAILSPTCGGTSTAEEKKRLMSVLVGTGTGRHVVVVVVDTQPLKTKLALTRTG